MVRVIRLTMSKRAGNVVKSILIKKKGGFLRASRERKSSHHVVVIQMSLTAETSGERLSYDSRNANPLPLHHTINNFGCSMKTALGRH